MKSLLVLLYTLACLTVFAEQPRLEGYNLDLGRQVTVSLSVTGSIYQVACSGAIEYDEMKSNRLKKIGGYEIEYDPIKGDRIKKIGDYEIKYDEFKGDRIEKIGDYSIEYDKIKGDRISQIGNFAIQYDTIKGGRISAVVRQGAVAAQGTVKAILSFSVENP